LGMTIAIYPTKKLITITRQLYGVDKTVDSITGCFII
jgi:hypothetical protein